MALRSKIVIAYHDKLFRAAENGRAVRLSDLRRIDPNRDPFGVIWELRRHGAETIAVRSGRKVVGWQLKRALPDTPVRLDEPTIQSYVEMVPGLFGPIKKPVLKRRGLPFSPLAGRRSPQNRRRTFAA